MMRATVWLTSDVKVLERLVVTMPVDTAEEYRVQTVERFLSLGQFTAIEFGPIGKPWNVISDGARA